MNTRTRQVPRPTAAGRARSTAPGRFSRPGAVARRTPATAGRAIPRPHVPFARRPPQKSTTEKLVGWVTDLLPGSDSKRTSSGAKGTAGVAALAGAAALAFKNRDKLIEVLSRNRSEPTSRTPAPQPPTVAPGDPPAAA
jgi:hypothetical protein